MKKYKIIAIGVIAVCVVFLSYTFYAKIYNKKTYGSFSIEAVIYENADMGISEVIEVELSKVYYCNDLMIERNKLNDTTYQFCLIKDKAYSGYFYALDSLYFKKKIDIYTKRGGLVYFGDSLPNYSKRIAMSDTILDKIHFKRFAINTDIEYSVFYLNARINKLPYSFNRVAEKDYKATIQRIDTYDRQNDRFISLRLSYTDSIPKIYFNKLNSFKL